MMKEFCDKCGNEIVDGKKVHITVEFETADAVESVTESVLCPSCATKELVIRDVVKVENQEMFDAVVKVKPVA